MSEAKLNGYARPTFTVRVDLRSRQTLGAERSCLELLTQCPLRGSHEPVENCTSCQHFAGIRFVRRSRFGAVHCVLSDQAVHELDPDAILSRSSAKGGAVSDVMARDVLCVQADLSVSQLSSIFIEHRITGAPVVTSEGLPIGVVTETDLLRWVYADRASASVPTVGDIMTRVALCLRANESIARAAALMAFEKVQSMPVISASGTVVGLVTALDILAWLARRNGFVLGDTA